MACGSNGKKKTHSHNHLKHLCYIKYSPFVRYLRGTCPKGQYWPGTGCGFKPYWQGFLNISVNFCCHINAKLRFLKILICKTRIVYAKQKREVKRIIPWLFFRPDKSWLLCWTRTTVDPFMVFCSVASLICWESLLFISKSPVLIVLIPLSSTPLLVSLVVKLFFREGLSSFFNLM